MENTLHKTDLIDSIMEESYRKPVVIDDLSRRRVDKEASFVLPFLKPGMRLLDCGCGPGSITLGLAKAVNPGEVIGIDVEKGLLKLAEQRRVNEKITNLRFEEGSILELDFPDDSFDVVFSHAVLFHLGDYKKALVEMRRVLKPGGFIGIRNSEKSGDILAPRNFLLERGWDLVIRAMQYRHEQPFFASVQQRVLRELGFVNIVTSASFDCADLADEIQRKATNFDDFFTDEFVDFCVQHQWASADELREIVAAFRRWKSDPDAFLATARCEAVAWKQ